MEHNGHGETDTELLRAEIRRTRAELGDTVQALAAKADVKARVRASATQTRERVLESAVHTRERAGAAVRGNPVPWAALAAGAAAAIILLMVIQRRRS
ncbi:DUF3618 domain-containing protein [Actinomycetes bacterium KLBMP 9797]